MDENLKNLLIHYEDQLEASLSSVLTKKLASKLLEELLAIRVNDGRDDFEEVQKTKSIMDDPKLSIIVLALAVFGLLTKIKNSSEDKPNE